MRRIGLLGLAGALAMGGIAYGHDNDASQVQLVVQKAQADVASRTLLIDGRWLVSHDARYVHVTLAGTPLVVLSATSAQVRAQLPAGIVPGDYLLKVWRGSGTAETDAFFLTIGGAGLAGPPGPKGDKGDKGDTGPQGLVGSTGQTGATGPAGHDGRDGHDGQNGHDGRDGMDGAPGSQGPPGSPGTVTHAAPPCFGSAIGGGRTVDCGNGTVTDTYTGLVWLKDASCLGSIDYWEASIASGALADGQCGLLDGSAPGDWRLATREDWEITVRRAVALGCITGGSGAPPSLTNGSGFGCLTNGFTPFVGVQADVYWTATPWEDLTGLVHVMSLENGRITDSVKGVPHLAWAVRGRR